jgi:hypothetical protein
MYDLKTLLLFLFSLLAIPIWGQSQTSPVPTSTSIPKWWNTQEIKPRVAIGLQKSFFTEIGIAKHWMGGDIVVPRSTALYSSLEWVPSHSGSVYGAKVGAETISGMGISGLEVKYQTNFHVQDVVITPKIGVSLLGSASLFYGYNISVKKLPFHQVGKHQFSLVLLYDKSDWQDIF